MVLEKNDNRLEKRSHADAFSHCVHQLKNKSTQLITFLTHLISILALLNGYMGQADPVKTILYRADRYDPDFIQKREERVKGR